MSRSKAKKSVKGLPSFVPEKGVRFAPSLPAVTDNWLIVAARHIGHGKYLCDHGWRGSVAHVKALQSAKYALETALFWSPKSPNLIALIDKIEDALTTPAR